MKCVNIGDVLKFNFEIYGGSDKVFNLCYKIWV